MGFFGKGRDPETGQKQKAGGRPEGDSRVLPPLGHPPQKDGSDRITRVSRVSVGAERPTSPGGRGDVSDRGHEIVVQKGHSRSHDDGENTPGEPVVSCGDTGDASAETPETSHDRIRSDQRPSG